MMTAHDKPVLRRTIAFLRDYAQSRGLAPGDALPSVRNLAALSESSYVTVCKALRELRAAGFLTLVNGRTHAIAGSPAKAGRIGLREREPRRAGATLRPWQRAAAAILDDIKNSAVRPGAPLPSLKELQRRHRFSYRAVKKALTHLVDERSLDALANGGFAAPALVTGAWKPSILCIVGSPDSLKMLFGQNDEALFRALESLCEQARIRIDGHLQFSDHEHDRYRFRQLSSSRIFEIEDLERVGGDSTQGLVYFIIWPPTVQDERTITALLANGKPLAVLGETAALRLPREVAGSPLLRVFAVAATSGPARIVADHLLSLRHRRIAFFSVTHEYVWSKARLDGLTEGHRRAGVTGGVRAFVRETPGLLDDAVRRCRFEALAACHRTWQRRIPPAYRVDFDVALDKLQWDYCARAEQRFLLQPLFEEALADREITAWVAVNDATASMALAFLKDRGVRVPGDLSLISFDDSPVSLIDNFSSFNFNVQAIAAAMLGFILGRKPYAESSAETRGFIVDRGSTGPARVRGPLPRTRGE